MKVLNYIKKLSLFVAMLALAGCGENLYSLTNKTILDQMNTDLAYIQDNCEQVIINLEKKQLTIPLIAEEKYQYVSSLLSCSGFDVRGSLAMALGPSDGFEDSTDNNPINGPLDTMYAFINKDSFDTKTVAELTVVYSKALLQCTGRTNNNLRIICTLVGGASNTVAVTKILLNLLARQSIPADQNALNNILDLLSPGDKSAFIISGTESLYSSMLADDPDYESRLLRSATAIQAGLSTLESLIGNSNGGDDNLLISMLDISSDTILNSSGLGMSSIMAIVVLDMFKI